MTEKKDSLCNCGTKKQAIAQAAELIDQIVKSNDFCPNMVYQVFAAAEQLTKAAVAMQLIQTAPDWDFDKRVAFTEFIEHEIFQVLKTPEATALAAEVVRTVLHQDRAPQAAPVDETVH